MDVVKSSLSDAGLWTPGAAPGAVVTRMRERVAVTGDADPVSQDIFIGSTAEPEKHHRMVLARVVLAENA